MRSEFGVSETGDATIYKYPLSSSTVTTIEVLGSIVHVGVDPGGNLCAWAVVWPNKFNPIPRDVAVVGTGEPFPAGEWSYLDTVHDGPFVWHVFVGKALR